VRNPGKQECFVGHRREADTEVKGSTKSVNNRLLVLPGDVPQTHAVVEKTPRIQKEEKRRN
jgi:hypothetical protein